LNFDYVGFTKAMPVHRRKLNNVQIVFKLRVLCVGVGVYVGHGVAPSSRIGEKYSVSGWGRSFTFDFPGLCDENKEHVINEHVVQNGEILAVGRYVKKTIYQE
jgi:hypothetical protein